MNFGGDPTQKLGVNTTSTAINNPLSTTPATFTFSTPSTSAPAGSTTSQFKPPQTSIPSTNVPTSSTATTGFNFGSGSALLNLKGPITTSSAPSTNTLGVSSGEKKLGTAAPVLSSGTTPSTSQPLAPQQTTASTTPATSFLSTTAAGGEKQVSQMTYEELETNVNKMIGKLTDNEEEFAKIARELNEWDKSINENSEKLLLLTETVKTVKSAQIKLSYDLDFIAIEHKDFESIVSTCEKEVENYNFSHPSRNDVYQKAINVDIQVRRMCEELREVIEHLNDRLRFCESDDPVMQIGRVLNAHMESLKWVDESTSQIHDYINYLSQIQEQMKKKHPQIGN